jgi:hypothetical protein
MDLDRLLPGVLGAFVGVIGWLFVGIYIQRRQFARQARNAARAVYFELDVNRAAVSVAMEFGSFTPLERTSFERLLPELATLLSPRDLRTVVAAYMAHAGYQQASADDLPPPVRAQLLESILAAHEQAAATLQARAFSPAEARDLASAEPTASRSGSTTSPDRSRRTAS